MPPKAPRPQWLALLFYGDIPQRTLAALWENFKKISPAPVETFRISPHIPPNISPVLAGLVESVYRSVYRSVHLNAALRRIPEHDRGFNELVSEFNLENPDGVSHLFLVCGLPYQATIAVDGVEGIRFGEITSNGAILGAIETGGWLMRVYAPIVDKTYKREFGDDEQSSKKRRAAARLRALLV